MESKRVDIRIGEQVFSAHLNLQAWGVEAVVYPMLEWDKPSTGEHGIAYTSIKDGSCFDELNDECRTHFRLTCSYPGCWDERLYFTDNEYWADEMKVMAALVEDVIQFARAFYSHHTKITGR